MRRLVGVVLLGLLIAPVLAVGADADDEAISETATRLVKTETTRVGKLHAVHSFMRDEIREVKARYS